MSGWQRHDVFGRAGEGLGVAAPGRAQYQKARQQHRGQAGRHREAGVVGAFRHVDDERVRTPAVRTAQFPVAVAGEDEMPDVVDELVSQSGGREALGAVTGPAERHHQCRCVALQEVERTGDDARRRDGLDPAVQMAPKGGRRDLADERRAACPGQDDPEVGTTGDPAKEPGGLLGRCGPRPHARPRVAVRSRERLRHRSLGPARRLERGTEN